MFLLEAFLKMPDHVYKFSSMLKPPDVELSINHDQQMSEHCPFYLLNTLVMDTHQICYGQSSDSY